MAHTCHATGCPATIPPRMFMCKRHWFALPNRLRTQIWATYREGQEDDKNPSKAYCTVARAAVIYLAEGEGKTPDTSLYDMYLRAEVEEGEQP